MTVKNLKQKLNISNEYLYEFDNDPDILNDEFGEATVVISFGN